MELLTNMGVAAFFYILLYLGHYWADFVCQTSDQAMKKITDTRIRLVHSIQYAYGTLLLPTVFLIYLLIREGIGVNWGVVGILVMNLIILFGTHFLIDDRKIVKWIIKKWKKEDPAKAPDFIIIEIDQTLHKFILLVTSVSLAQVPMHSFL